MGPCKECGKSTRSHIIGSEYYCHTCWKGFPDEKKDDIVRMQKAREARLAIGLAAAATIKANIERATKEKQERPLIELGELETNETD